MTIAKIEQIVGDLVDRETGEGTPHGLGKQQGQRLKAVANLCVVTWPGDLIEIGCYTGGTTRLLARVARAHGRRVIAVDPWADDEAVCEKFLENIAGYWRMMDIIHSRSQEPQVIEQIKACPLCFAYVDGLHTHDGLLSDIRAVGHCAGVIVVDDVSYECEPENLRPACWLGAQELGRVLYWHPKCREAYLIPC
jgi:cephalosporin hydroxylase